jgi:hypothetical protein
MVGNKRGGDLELYIANSLIGAFALFSLQPEFLFVSYWLLYMFSGSKYKSEFGGFPA